jgi:hypothetical protein
MSVRLYKYLFYLYLFGISGWWRQFARLPGDLLGAPIYITEIVLVLGLLVVARIAYSSSDWQEFLIPSQLRKSALPPLLLILLCLVPLRVFPGYFEFGFQALRDGVMLVYLLFIPLLFWLRNYLHIRHVLLVIFCGQSAGVLSYYVVNHLYGIHFDFLYPLSNETVFALPLVAVLILFNRWGLLGIAMLCLVPTILSNLFWLKRSFLLGSVIVISALLAYHPDTFRNMGRLFTAFALGLVFSIGLLFLPEIAKPVYKDASVLIGMWEDKLSMKLSSFKNDYEALSDTQSSDSSVQGDQILTVESQPKEGTYEDPAKEQNSASRLQGGDMPTVELLPTEGANEVPVKAENSASRSEGNIPTVELSPIEGATEGPAIVQSSATHVQDDDMPTVEISAIEGTYVAPAMVQSSASHVQDDDMPTVEISALEGTYVAPAKAQISVSSVVGQGFIGPRLLHGEDTKGAGLMSWRLHLWNQALSEIAQKPLWGWGFGPIVVKTLPGGVVLTEETFISGPHNAYITVIYRLGWPLFFVFMCVPLCFLYRAAKSRRRMNEMELIALSVVAYSYFNAFFSLGFESPQNSVPAYILMGLLVGSLWHAKNALHENSADTGSRQNSSQDTRARADRA